MSESPKLTAKPVRPPAAPSRRFGFAKHQRLLNKTDFSRVFNDAPLRASHANLLVLARSNPLGYPRLGVVVGKKNVKRAHQRNQFKRQARESFRLQQHNLPPIDAIVLARRGADRLEPAELRKTLNGLWQRIRKRALKQPDNA